MPAHGRRVASDSSLKAPGLFMDTRPRPDRSLLPGKRLFFDKPLHWDGSVSSYQPIAAVRRCAVAVGAGAQVVDATLRPLPSESTMRDRSRMRRTDPDEGSIT
jgi:hypothetical protein